MLIMQSRQEWPERKEVALPSVPGTTSGFFSMHGKTAGMLVSITSVKDEARINEADP